MKKIITKTIIALIITSPFTIPLLSAIIISKKTGKPFGEVITYRVPTPVVIINK